MPPQQLHPDEYPIVGLETFASSSLHAASAVIYHNRDINPEGTGPTPDVIKRGNYDHIFARLGYITLPDGSIHLDFRFYFRDHDPEDNPFGLAEKHAAYKAFMADTFEEINLELTFLQQTLDIHTGLGAQIGVPDAGQVEVYHAMGPNGLTTPRAQHRAAVRYEMVRWRTREVAVGPTVINAINAARSFIVAEYPDTYDVGTQVPT